MTELEAYVPSSTQEGVYWRVGVEVVSGRVHLTCTCPAGRARKVPLPCKHAKQALQLEPTVTQAPVAPGHNKQGRPIYPPNIRALTD